MTKQALIARSPIGIFAFNDKGELIYYKLFEKDVDKVIAAMKEKTPEEFFDKLKGYQIRTNTETAKSYMRKNMREYAISLGFASNNRELNEFLNDLGIALTRSGMKTSITRDKLIIQARNALNDLDDDENNLVERLREWYGLHYPELDTKKMSFIDDIIEHGIRENFPNFKQSTGIEFNEEDERIVKDFASMIQNRTKQKKVLEKYITDAIEEIAPNFSSLIDPLLGAKLLSLAGSIEKLAKMTTSSIQLLGAEKALFRHLREKSKSPKFGVLFLAKPVQKAPQNKQGKVARVIASKLMMAIRIDYYSHRDDSKRLKKELEEDMKKVLYVE